MLPSLLEILTAERWHEMRAEGEGTRLGSIRIRLLDGLPLNVVLWDIHVSLRMNCYNFGDPLSFPLVLSS